jgi:hypothetical protein
MGEPAVDEEQLAMLKLLFLGGIWEGEKRKKEMPG